MAGFADDFPDVAVMAALGDVITLVKSGGGTVTFNGVFEYKYIEMDEVDRLDVIYPVIECNDADASAVDRKDKLQFDGKTYGVFKKRPIDVGMTQIILKD